MSVRPDICLSTASKQLACQNVIKQTKSNTNHRYLHLVIIAQPHLLDCTKFLEGPYLAGRNIFQPFYSKLEIVMFYCH